MRAARARSSAHAALSRAADARTAASSDSGSNRFRASSESAIACNWATWSGVQPSESRNPITPILGLRGSLGCTPDQVAQLQAIADSLDARNRLLPESLDAAVRASAARDNAAWALERARAALMPEQWRQLPDALKSLPLVLNDYRRPRPSYGTNADCEESPHDP